MKLASFLIRKIIFTAENKIGNFILFSRRDRLTGDIAFHGDDSFRIIANLAFVERPNSNSNLDG